MRRPTGSEPVRAVPKVLLVDWFKHHDHRPLKDLVLKGRYPDRTRGRAIVPLRRSAIRRPLPSTGSRRVGSPASVVVRGAPTPCRPSRRTSLPSLGGTALALAGSLLPVTERRHLQARGFD